MLLAKNRTDHIKRLLLCAITADFYLQLVKGRKCSLLLPDFNVHTTL